ncbi:MAG: hypothetical protein AWU59_1498 [Methanolobus sp. T82-4]|jgi:hypothetical protein|nr:MAG: hypothetical protein AWU59_1498 [Methanolobus sp. T82-4]
MNILAANKILTYGSIIAILYVDILTLKKHPVNHE